MRAIVRHLGSLPLPWGLLLTLSVILGVERSVARRASEFSNDWSVDRVWTARAARTQAPACEILCLGDSQVKFGVIPALLEARLGAKAFNLAVHGGQPQEAYVLLRRVLAAGGRPTALVLDFKPFLLTHPLSTRLRPYAELLTWAECASLAHDAADPGVFGSIAARKLSPTLRARDEIRADVLAALQGRAISSRWLAALRTRNWRSNRGAQIMAQGEFHRIPYEQFGYFARPWACDPLCLRYLDRLLDLATAHGMTVFYLLPPIQPELQEVCDRSGYDGSYARFVGDLAARHANLVVIDGRHSAYGVAALSDSLHLNRLGASVLSRDLADVMARRTRGGAGSPRWVDLPPFDRSRGVSEAEDMNESLAALQNPGAPVRR
jgi:hypothetical protein